MLTFSKSPLDERTFQFVGKVQRASNEHIFAYKMKETAP
jgi:hypothetical protein